MKKATKVPPSARIIASTRAEWLNEDGEVESEIEVILSHQVRPSYRYIEILGTDGTNRLRTFDGNERNLAEHEYAALSTTLAEQAGAKGARVKVWKEEPKGAKDE